MNKTNLIIYPIAFIVLLLDQVSKLLISNYVDYGQKIAVIDGMFSITKLFNTGAAFSILEDHIWLLSLLSFIAILAICIYFLKTSKSYSKLILTAWGLILGGTFGNFIDRVAYQHVIDFIYLDFIKFPVFNIADIAINIGAVLVLLRIIIAPEKENESI